MPRFLVVLALAAAAFAAVAATASAGPAAEPQALAGIGPFVDPFVQEANLDALATSTSPGTEHFGPIPSTSPDSGTCGNDWAEDTFDRFFTIHDNGDGTFRVVEQFKNGSFVTNAGASPGSCDPSDGYGPGTLTQGLTGTMHGYLEIDVTGVRNPGTSCSDPGNPCGTTGGAIAHLFTGAFTIDTFFFHYAGYDGSNQALAVNEWKNASCNRGGNHGDIATATLPLALSGPCLG